ncbi:MAG: hypothetical protein LBO66_04590 [Deltaproteobacteria bacterium]|nr:hypothetical protein [Deltaproteobacteria bacterium]
MVEPPRENTRLVLPFGRERISGDGYDLPRGAKIRVGIKPIVYPRSGAEMVNEFHHADMVTGRRYFFG